jgi:cell division protein FtsZ
MPTVKGSQGDDKPMRRAEKAAIEAISSPLFDGRSIRGAKKVLVNVTGGPSLGIREAMAATDVIQDEAGDDCEVLFGAMIRDDMPGRLQVTILATGLEESSPTDRPVRLSANDVTDLNERDAHPGDGAATPAVLNEAVK